MPELPKRLAVHGSGFVDERAQRPFSLAGAPAPPPGVLGDGRSGRCTKSPHKLSVMNGPRVSLSVRTYCSADRRGVLERTSGTSLPSPTRTIAPAVSLIASGLQAPRRLWVEPNDPHGTTFLFSVPLG